MFTLAFNILYVLYLSCFDQIVAYNILPLSVTFKVSTRPFFKSQKWSLNTILQTLGFGCARSVRQRTLEKSDENLTLYVFIKENLTVYTLFSYFSQPIALISWGCFYGTSSVNKTDMKAWIRAHAFKGPASDIHKSGTFNKHLVKGSDIVTDNLDSVVCPNETEVINTLHVTTLLHANIVLIQNPSAQVPSRYSFEAEGFKVFNSIQVLLLLSLPVVFIRWKDLRRQRFDRWG